MRILLPHWRDEPWRSFYQEFYPSVREALLELGHEPVEFPFADINRPQQEEIDRLVGMLASAKFDAVLDLACWSANLSRIVVSRAGARTPIFDHYGIPYVALLLDHPFNQWIHRIQARRLFAAYPDRGHPQQARLAYPGFQPHAEIFAPPAVRPANDCSVANGSGRDIDVLYIGNLDLEALQRFWRWPTAPADWHVHEPTLCDAIADAALSEPERPLHLSIEQALGSTAGASRSDLFPHLRAAEFFLRHTFRHRAVMALANSGAPMLVVGKGWQQAGLPANVRLQEQTDYDGLYRLAGRAKICLDASTYLDGANDRVFAYAVNGAVCFTNAGGYLRSAIGEENGVRFYSLQDTDRLAEEVKELLAQPSALREAGSRAREVTLSSHTWRHRMESILRAVAAKS